jgi:hypothetical protein
MTRLKNNPVIKFSANFVIAFMNYMPIMNSGEIGFCMIVESVCDIYDIFCEMYQNNESR